MHKLIKYILFLFTLLITWFTIHTIVIIFDGINDELENVDAAVVLGNKVELNGDPSNRLQARLEKALELYNEGYFELVIVSGGVGREGFDEAKVMKQYLVEQGIPSEQVIVDSNGYNTRMTAENTKEIFNDLGLDSVMIVTQFFHVSRTKLAFKQEGINEVYGVHAEFFESRDLYSTVREFPAFYKYLFFD